MQNIIGLRKVLFKPRWVLLLWVLFHLISCQSSFAELRGFQAANVNFTQKPPANFRSVVARYVDTPPQIDGKLSDAAWKDGAWFTDFHNIDGTEGQLAEVPTFFQIVYDDHYLYIGAKLLEPNPGELKIGAFKHDWPTHRDDALEISLDPTRNRDKYYYFIVNPIGFQYDAQRIYGGAFSSVSWDATWESATQIESDAWYVEIAIPFSELQLSESSLSKPWAFNIARQRRASAVNERSSFSPMTGGTFHTPQNFSLLHLDDHKAILKKYLWQLDDCYGHAMSLENDQWVFSAKIDLHNIGSNVEKVKLMVRQQLSKSFNLVFMQDQTIALGQTTTIPIRFPIKKTSTLDLEFLVVGENEEVLLSQMESIPANYDILKIDFINPHYRNAIYYDADGFFLRFKANLAFADPLIKNYFFKVAVYLRDFKAPLVNFTLTDLKKEKIYTIDLPKELASGNYLLEVELIDTEGKVIEHLEIPFKKLKKVPHYWSLDKEGRLIHNGEPFLPSGLFDVSAEAFQLVKSAFNTTFVLDSSSRNYTLEELEESLDRLAEKGIYAILTPYQDAQNVWSYRRAQKSFTHEELKALKEKVRRLKNHPALLGWFIAHNPEFNSMSEKRLSQVQAIMEEEDPYHPTISVNSSSSGIKKYQGISDISMPENELVFSRDKGPLRPLHVLHFYFEQAKRLSKYQNALWSLLQAEDYRAKGFTQSRAPVFKELRNMLYQSVTANSRAFFWDGYSYAPNYSDLQIGVPFLSEEIFHLKDLILAPVDITPVEISSVTQESFHWQLKRFQDQSYLFAVNTSPTSYTLDIQSDCFKDAKSLYVLSEGRSVEVNRQGKFVDTFAPWEVHIYGKEDLTKALPTVSEVHKAIEELNAKRFKSGNIAFQEHFNTQLQSSDPMNDDILKYLVDGVFEGISWELNPTLPLPQWVDLSWPIAHTIKKVVIYGTNIQAAYVAINQANTWVKIADLTPVSSAQLETSFSPSVSNKLRVVITAKRPNDGPIALSEVEVY